MELTNKGIEKSSDWKNAGYQLPIFHRQEMIQRTKKNPRWVHFGAGNIFRAFQARAVQRLLNENRIDTGLIVAEGFDYEIIEKLNRRSDDLTILITLKADGTMEKTVIASIAESLRLDSDNVTELERMKEIFGNPSLQMASFTITEKGYSLVTADGDLLPSVASDFTTGPKRPASYMGKVVALLYQRYQKGAMPIAMVSMDNCSHNGDKLKEAVTGFAKAWVKHGLVEAGFLTYVEDSEDVSFPWSMIDKITPRPDNQVKDILINDGVQGMEPIITSKNTYASAFVNAEECEYLVIEDSFPNGHPPLEEVGIILTDRDTVDKVEKMKVCTCLNPLHTALAIFGCILGYDLISEEMKDVELKGLVERIGYQEGLPVVVNPEIIEPRKFLDEVLTLRIPNPFMPDTPQRIATDTSQKLAIRFGETIKAYQKSDCLKVADLQMIPLVFAGWLRYLMAVDDKGQAFELSPDPMLDMLCPSLQKIKIGTNQEVEAIVRPILKNTQIFGVDLYKVGLADTVLRYFTEMISGKGMVRAVLKKYV